MSRVFVVQYQHKVSESTGKLEPKFDLAPAEKHGRMSYLLSPTARPFSPEHVIGELREKLSSFSDDDHLLLIGNPALIGFAVAIAAHVNGGRVSVLQWDGRRRNYVAIKADMSVDKKLVGDALLDSEQSEWTKTWQ